MGVSSRARGAFQAFSLLFTAPYYSIFSSGTDIECSVDGSNRVWELYDPFLLYCLRCISFGTLFEVISKMPSLTCQLHGVSINSSEKAQAWHKTCSM